MGLLTNTEKMRLLRIEGIRDYLEDVEEYYIRKLKEWKKILQSNPELNDPEMLAAQLTQHLEMEDERLASLTWDIWRTDELRIRKIYENIGKYFVDREAGL